MKKLFVLFLCLFVGNSFASGIASNSASAPCDNETLSKYTGTANVEINWEPNTINLNWYDGDTKLTVANNSQTCVYDGTLTVPTQPTKPGYTFNGWKVIHVPGGFTELEYVHFDGTSSTGAYVDTGLKFYTDIPNTQVRFVADVKVYSDSDYWQVILGNIGYVDYIGTGGSIIYYASSSGDKNTGVNNPFERCLFDLDLVAGTYKVNKISNNAQIVNISGITTGVNTYSIPIYLGGFTNDPSGGSGMRAARANMDLYSVKIYNNGELMFNGIPAKRNVDNVVGIYDTISGTFKTNATGTNALTAGPVVQ